jgi:hypothetical protein
MIPIIVRAPYVVQENRNADTRKTICILRRESDGFVVGFAPNVSAKEKVERFWSIITNPDALTAQ